MRCFIVLYLFSLIAFANHQNLYSTKASAAFIARDYTTALAEFSRLMEEHPFDLTIQRYKALCLDRLGRHKEAVEILKKILLISNDQVAVHYHLATVYYKMQESGLAEQHFNEVVSLASSTKYGELSEVYLDAISQQRFGLIKPGAPKRWSIYALIGITNDIGSRLSYDGTDRSGLRTSAYTAINNYYLRNQSWTASVGVSVYRSHHDHSSLKDNDYKQWGVNHVLQQQTNLLGLPFINRLGVSYKSLSFGSDKYSDGFSISLSSRVRFTKNTATNFYLNYGEDDFEPLLGLDEDLSLKNQDSYFSGVDHSVYFKQRSIELGTGVFFSKLNSNSRNFNRDGVGGKFYARFLLPLKLQLRLNSSYRTDDYPDYLGDSDRGFKSKTYSASLTRTVNKNFSFSLVYRKNDIDHSSNFGDNKNSNIGLNLSYVY